MKVKALQPSQLYHHCDPSLFSFKTTEELENVTEVFGQKRALDAVNFGTGIQEEGYNLFVMGPPGMGKRTTVHRLLEPLAASQATPNDYCYVNNFTHSHQPRALCLPAGTGQKFSRDMDQLVEELRISIPAAFESEQYRKSLHDIEEEFKQYQEKAFEELQNEAETQSISLFRTPSGYAFAPLRKGEVITPEEFEKLPQKEQERIESVVNTLQKKLEHIIQEFSRIRRENREKIKNLNAEVVMFAVGHLIDDLKKEYADLPEILKYLDIVQQDVMENFVDFKRQDEGMGAGAVIGIQPQAPSFQRYKVNVLVEHGANHGAPIIDEGLPTYQNLIGRVEHISQFGALVTDFTLIKPGALHKANGGYLILDARKVLMQPYAWEGLKRVIESREIRIESVGQMLSLISTLSLEPQPIPLKIKVILIGERLLYYLLSELDPEFNELFKVVADFDEDIVRNNENNFLYVRLIAILARKSESRPFDATAVARVIEHSSRLASDAEKLSTHVRGIADLLKEANYWTGQAKRDIITASDVQQAIDTQIQRASRIHERILENIQRGTLLIDTEGTSVGQVNGLSVIELGGFEFGQPSRITSTARLGEGDVVDIEHEVELGGSIHSKGVLILSSFLSSRYAAERPLSLSASIVFEQSYGMIEGDSASTAELCALLSALGEIPIKQSLAVTGSVNQHGQIQPIGAVNEKIEGFFDTCKLKGLTGEQGVLIPSTNVNHLMLRKDIVEAAAADQFHIYPIETIDQAIELLTGIPAGVRDAQGEFPKDSVNERIESRMKRLSEIRQEFLEKAMEKHEAK